MRLGGAGAATLRAAELKPGATGKARASPSRNGPLDCLVLARLAINVIRLDAGQRKNPPVTTLYSILHRGVNRQSQESGFFLPRPLALNADIQINRRKPPHPPLTA